MIRMAARLVRLLLVVVGMVVCGFTGPSAAGAAAACSGQVQPPRIGGDQLSGVAVISSCNAWAVGWVVRPGVETQTLAEHWNGQAWKKVSTPDPAGATTSQLFGVAAVSATDIWAVGSYVNSPSEATLIEHWNGKRWSQVASSAGGSVPNGTLSAVAASSPKSVWAVGSYVDGGGNRRTFIEHWDGVRWTQVHSPDPGGPIGAMPAQNSLTGLAVVSPASAWAVGSYTAPYQCCSVGRTLILHWNGRAWKKMASPDAGGPGFHDNGLSGVSARAGNAWAVGGYWNGSAPRTLTLHWNGRIWAQVASPNPSVAPYADDLKAVTEISPSGAIAVGYWTRLAGAEQTFVIRWNGRRWRQLTSSDPGGSQYNNELVAVAGTMCSNLWAVGDYSNSNPWIIRSVTARC